MKLNIYVFKNLTLGCSGNPIYDDHEPDVFSKGMERKILTSKPEEVVQFTNTELYHIGIYDDETLRFTNCEPVLLLDFNKVLDDRKVRFEILKKVQEAREASKKEGDSDGKGK